MNGYDQLHEEIGQQRAYWESGANSIADCIAEARKLGLVSASEAQQWQGLFHELSAIMDQVEKKKWADSFGGGK